MRLSNEGLVGRGGQLPADESERRSSRRHGRGAGAGTVSALLVPIGGCIRATIVGAQPNKRLELAPPVVVELHL